MKIKYTALLLIVVSGFMLLLSPLGSVSTTLAQQERLRDQEVDSSKDQAQELIDGGPCGIARVEEARKQKIEEALQGFKESNVWLYSSPGSVTIPVYFHVIMDNNGNGNVSEETLNAQISVLNNSFGGLTFGANTSFRFAKAGVTRTYNSSWFNMPSPLIEPFVPSPREVAAKSALRVGGATELNFYTINATTDESGRVTNENSAWAQFPWEYAGSPCLDGVVVPYTMMPGGTRLDYNEGDIAVHEIGHWLGLWHTYEGGCTNPNDEVNDTPAQRVLVGCPPDNSDSCPGEFGYDPVHNFMGATSDACKTQFTAGQSTRMDSMYTIFRRNHRGVSPTASITWIAPAEYTWGQPNTMTVAGYAQNGCGNVQLVWRDTTTGGPWNVVEFEATPSPTDNTWSNTLASPYECHNFEAYVNYSGITSPVFHYNGRNSGYCDESVGVIWIQPQTTCGCGSPGSLVVAGSATGAPAGTQVYMWYRDATAGTGWFLQDYAPITDPNGIWINEIPNADFSHVYEVYVEYDVVNATCVYWGNNSINWCQ